MSDRVTERLRAEITEHGPLRFDEFMRIALYGDGGYYASPPVGPSGDFVTSPHVHPVFSRLVGLALEDRWRALGSPAPLRLVELGAGDGTMARELVAGFRRGGVPLSYEAVEVGAGAREALASMVDRVVDDLDDVEALDPGLVLANELLDNLPFRRLRRRGDETVEVRVAANGDRFVESESAVDPQDLGVEIPLEGEVVVPTAAFDLVERLATKLRCGYALLIDYAPRRDAATPVRGYRAHRIVDDVLATPGAVDVTAGVDLDAVVERARRAGLVAFEHVDQRRALLALGFERWARSETEHQAELLDADRGTEAVRTWEGRGRARLLIDPDGLGSFRWLLLATGDLPEPEWLSAAARPLD